MLVDHNVFVPGKKAYVMGEKPDVDCILCAVRDGDPKVKSLLIHEYENFLITCNLFPFNSGHIMIFPRQHICCLRELPAEHVGELHQLTVAAIDILEREYQCGGFNIGYNIGLPSGGSIPHLHRHIIPRYPREMGLIDIIGGARVIVEDPCETLERLRECFKEVTL
jgi:ATP adenylyltransferase